MVKDVICTVQEFGEKTGYDVVDIISSIEQFEGKNVKDLLEMVEYKALANVSIQEPLWEKLAAQMLLQKIVYEASKNRNSFIDSIKKLTEQGIYSPALLSQYTEEELRELQDYIRPERSQMFTYVGLKTLADRYLARDHERNFYELPQERFMIIAMELASVEKEKVYWAKKFYDVMSNLYLTVATPTLSNAGKTYSQLSSCFIDTVEDDLHNIYENNTTVARLSKNGGGVGVYLGKIRSEGSYIKKFKNISSGVLAWMKQINTTAVNVDQLGMRQGAICCYLDVWHRDIFSFLDAKTNAGDDRRKTHEIQIGVCVPDLFMKQVKERGDWWLFDPKETLDVMGYGLEDYWGEEFEKRYWECVNEPRLTLKRKVPAIEVMKRIMISALETGNPFIFFRDTVNRDNPNKHKGIIYCSNLCTEIAQNMSPTHIEQEYLEDDVIVVKKKVGDFVVCNLSSLNLPRAYDKLDKVIPIQMRMLDNVIELNKDRLEVLQAVKTNQKYRAVGLGTFGIHHLLALHKIKWESEEAVKFNEELYEEIAYQAIKASMELAKERGKYPAFEGSEWSTGEYISRKFGNSEKWRKLREEVKKNGVRNGYMIAIAPNSSTALIAGTTNGIDPVYDKLYFEEKKGIRVPVVVPNLSPDTFWYYKPAREIDQKWSIKMNAVRQKYIDQSISFNLYVKHDIKAKDLLNLYMMCWEKGLKTIYYVRSSSVTDIDECESCAS